MYIQQNEQYILVAPGTGTGAPQMDHRLLTNTWPKAKHTISIQANTNKS